MIRTLIADDEKLAVEGIRVRLEDEADFKVVGEAADGPAAVKAILEKRPDVVFLDVRMPGLNGFEVLKSVASEYLPSVVFVTAYDRYAMEAFDAHAIDYLLKPFSVGRFREAIRRVRLECAKEAALHEHHQRLVAALYGSSAVADSAAKSVEVSQAPELRWAVKHRGKFLVVLSSEVDWIDSAANYVQLHSDGRCLLLRSTMSELERQLDPNLFTRIHRTAIVNVAKVREILPLEYGDYSIVLQDRTTLRLSRSYRARFFGNIDVQKRFGRFAVVGA